LGDTFASRVGASLLTAVGLPELIARDCLGRRLDAVMDASVIDLSIFRPVHL